MTPPGRMWVPGLVATQGLERTGVGSPSAAGDRVCGNGGTPPTRRVEWGSSRRRRPRSGHRWHRRGHGQDPGRPRSRARVWPRTGWERHCGALHAGHARGEAKRGEGEPEHKALLFKSGVGTRSGSFGRLERVRVLHRGANFNGLGQWEQTLQAFRLGQGSSEPFSLGQEVRTPNFGGVWLPSGL